MPHISYIAHQGNYVVGSRRQKANLAGTTFFDVNTDGSNETSSDSGICPDSMLVVMRMRILSI